MQILSESIKNFNLWQWLILLLVLIPVSIQDIIKKKISATITLTGIFAGLVINMTLNPGEMAKYILCVIPGVLMIAISITSHEAIGVGDGILLLAIGAIVGLECCTKILFGAVFIAGIYAVIMLVTKKVTRRSAIPFAPFLLVGVLGMGLI